MVKDIGIKTCVNLSVFLATGSTVFESLCATTGLVNPFYITLVRYVAILYVFLYTIRKNIKISFDKSFLYFLIVYSLYILFYLTLGRQYPLNKMLGCPESVFGYLQHTFYLFLLILCSKTIFKFMSIRNICIMFLFFTLIPTLYYINLIGIETLQIVNASNSEAQFLGTLTFSYACSTVLILHIFFFNEYTSKKYLNIIILAFVICAVVYVWMAGTKRGPILWALISIIVCFYYKDKNFSKYFKKILIIGIIVYISLPVIFDFFKDIAPYTIERINAALYEGDTSHRLDAGNSDNGYSLAINQFLSSPLFGSYFRITDSTSIFKGVYPHNIFLEMMITMGVIGLIPFLFFVKKIYTSASKKISLSENKKQMFFFVLFNMSFFTMFTTDTILLNYSFWMSASYVLVYPQFKDKI